MKISCLPFKKLYGIIPLLPHLQDFLKQQNGFESPEMKDPSALLPQPDKLAICQSHKLLKKKKIHNQIKNQYTSFMNHKELSAFLSNATYTNIKDNAEYAYYNH